jgi:TRAP-type uncharacterized transport system fused permease subunit
MAGVVSILLGMGMPIVTVYIIVSILVAPAMIELGVSPVAAHMFIFYYGMLSFLTPPVCLSVYAASAVAGTPPLPLAAKAVRFASAAYIVPFAFVFDTSLLFEGGISLQTGFAFASAFVGVFGVAIGLEGYFADFMKAHKRILLIIAGLMCLTPHTTIRLVGMAVVICLLLAELMSARIHQRGRKPKACKSFC